jgi:hypothetical protein
MARLARSSHRLIWLNPLAGRPGFQPLTRGLVAALPHVDDFLPVHDLASLDRLAELLAGLGRRAAPASRASRGAAAGRGASPRAAIGGEAGDA